MKASNQLNECSQSFTNTMWIFRHTEKHRQYLCCICNMSCYRGNKSIDDYIGFDFPKLEPEVMIYMELIHWNLECVLWLRSRLTCSHLGYNYHFGHQMTLACILQWQGKVCEEPRMLHWQLTPRWTGHVSSFEKGRIHYTGPWPTFIQLRKWALFSCFGV